MRSSVFVLAAVLLAAGCIGKSPDPATTAARDDLDPSVIVDPSDVATGGALPTTAEAAPVWVPGDAWEITTAGDTSERATLVVIGADASSYTVATTSEEQASWDAILDVSYIGKIRASDLAGFQQDQPVQYFSFPLEDGKTWTAAWDGLEITLTASKGARGFEIVGTTPEGAEYVMYDYVPELKWWSHLHFTEGYGFKVERFVSGWQGELSTATASVVYESESTTPALNPAAGAFTIAEGQSFAMVILSGGGERWARGFALTQPDGTPFMTTTGNFESAPDGGGGYFVTERLPPLAGDWHIAAPTWHDPEGWGSVKVVEVATAKMGYA